MKILLAGCEYVGTTTISHKLNDWKQSVMGEGFSLLHDHSKLPHTSGHPDDTTLEEQQQILGLTPKLKEMYHRYHIYYHVHHYRGADDLSVGFHIEEAIYARMYYGYGLAGEQFDRDVITGQIEARLKQISEDPIVVVHMTATPDVLARRMAELKDSPEHTNSPVKESDIPAILERFEEGVARSTIGPKIHVDTSTVSPDETLAEIVEALRPHLTDFDRERIAVHGL
ncbi:MAG TPA: hypothetical protein QGI07_01860 [Dehalococcoidia bacterium]|nr:hypothetical protein [Chloroflexota bacterium]MDP5876108.1 hypothetical protein [Dehalococcoidia bacterium]MDP6273544.1 hypothetical protein [Dehalococcoidia bacterium]MDP7161357.1 hypothetical protein [Dehalococcoidia bacterium]MDP7213638.1 hypothetical protein [Dehalococcoidia bacterium]